jgi:pimeloyl-ACP methyl ester carboxylesterase
MHAAIAIVVLAALVAFAGHCPAAADEKDKVAPPEELTLKTGDGIALAATYYPSKLGKNAVPVILLHASKGNRGDLEELALKLQRAGHAVIAPDLRGHGDSTRLTDRPIELRAADCLAMVDPGGDLETIKAYLMARNNAGELNIEKLGLVGVEMGAVVAINWAARDWSWPMLNTGKQGEDVKAVVLISPEWSFKGLRIQEAVAQENVRSDISFMIIAGKGNSKMVQEARRLYTALERYHPAPATPDKQTLWLRTPQTSLQSTRLLNEKSMHVDEMILRFIELRLVKPAMPWSERKNPLE